MRAPLGISTLISLAVTLFLWASAFVAVRAGLKSYEPGQLALLRFAVASVALVGYAAVARMRLPLGRDLGAIALAGFFGITVYHVALNYGEVTVTAGSAALLVNTAPIFTALLATAFLGERLRALGWAGIGISFAGAALIALGEREGLSFDPGALLLILSALAFSLYAAIQRPYLRRFSPLQFTAAAIWAGTLPMIVFLPGITESVRTASLEATLSAVYLGIFPSALAYITWAHALSRIPASNAASFLYLVSPMAILIGWLWLGEVPTAIALVGGALALLGVMLVNAYPGKPAPTPASEPAKSAEP